MTSVDLQQLAFKRKEEPQGPRPGRNVVARYLIPGFIGLGFLAMIVWAAGDQLLPSHPVTVVPVLVTRAESQQGGTPLFQAAGWIEPRPTATLVSALTEGVVEELLVVEGQEIAAREPVAKLIDTEARYSVEQAEIAVVLRKSELANANSELKAAKIRLKRPVHLESAKADAESFLKKTETDLARIPFQLQAAKSRLDYTRRNLEGKESAESAIAGRIVQQARNEFEVAEAEGKELEQRRVNLQREVDALRRKYDAMSEQLELLVEENRSVGETQAKCEGAAARVRQAEAELKLAHLQLDRTIVRAAVAGRVMDLVARPGTQLTGGASGANTVVTLYDPNRLQVRADVRLEDVPMIVVGQSVEIQTASVKDSMKGQVLSVTSSANVQKNTLEVKIGITSPPPAIRPEMLVTATFLAVQLKGEEAPPTDQQRLFAPRSLIETSEAGPFVWIANDHGRAQKQSIRLGKATNDQLIEVVEGLRPTDKIISEGRTELSDGTRVRVRGEDSSVGVTGTDATAR